MRSRYPTRNPARFRSLTVVSSHAIDQPETRLILSFLATTHVKYLEMTASQLQTRLQQAEAEVQRLRTVNEALMLGTAEQRHAAAAAAVAAVSQHSSGF